MTALFSILSKTLFADKKQNASMHYIYIIRQNAYDIHRYKKTDIKALETYLKQGFDKIIAAALFNMHCHYKQYQQASNVFLEFLVNHENPDNSLIEYKKYY